MTTFTPNVLCSSYLSKFEYCKTIKCLLLNDTSKGIFLIIILSGESWSMLLAHSHLLEYKKGWGQNLNSVYWVQTYAFSISLLNYINQQLHWYAFGWSSTYQWISIEFLKVSHIKIYYQITLINISLNSCF